MTASKCWQLKMVCRMKRTKVFRNGLQTTQSGCERARTGKTKATPRTIMAHGKPQEGRRGAETESEGERREKWKEGEREKERGEEGDNWKKGEKEARDGERD